MIDSLFADNASRAAKAALDGLSLRQQAISRNIANVDTPGYQAQTVNFEDTLKSMLNNSGTLSLTTTNTAHQASPTRAAGFTVSNRAGGSFRADQNNVDIDAELSDMSEVGIQYQAVSQLVSKKLQLLKTLAR
jgi:flagellar basal-body rod protein FlgB